MTRCAVPAVYGGQSRRPVRSSISKAWCSVLTRMGDLPGMNHVRTGRGHSAFGRSPDAAHTSTRVRWEGKVRGGSPSDGSSASTASTTRKKRGADIWTPTNAGFPWPSKFPTHTARTYGPKMPTVHASRNPYEVPVFQYTGSRAG